MRFARLKKQILAVAALLVIVAAVIGIGWYTAERKSEPYYRSKIDKIIYDRKNKSPKYVIVLPDRLQAASEDKDTAEKNQPKTVSSSPERQTAAESSETSAEVLQKILSTMPSIERLPDLPQEKASLRQEADSSLEVDFNGMKIPQISASGQKPWLEYSRPSTVSPGFFKVAVIVKNLGLNKRTTQSIINKLPGEVSLAFSPYGRNNAELVRLARAAGHETYVDLYLSSKDFLKSDNGPLSMNITSGQEENLNRLAKTVSSFSPLGGVVVNNGIADEYSRPRLQVIFEKIRDMGLLLVDATGEDDVSRITVDGLSRSRADIVINDEQNSDSVTSLLTQAESIARQKGAVVIVLDPKPLAIIRLAEWLQTFSPQLSYEEMKARNITTIERPFALVPVSAVVIE